MKLRFIGTGSAFTVGGNYNSNMYFESDEGKRLLIDCGGDARHALHELGLSHKDIHAVYISHLHADHIGGLEWLAFATRYDPSIEQLLPLYIEESLAEPLWRILSGGLESTDNAPDHLGSYFDVHIIHAGGSFSWGGLDVELFQTIHQISDGELMPSFGLQTRVDDKSILLTADTRFPEEGDQLRQRYETADLIFHDCETSQVKSTVHAHYTELITLDPKIRAKMWLYHYQPGPLPDAVADGFAGFVDKGQLFDLSDPNSYAKA